MMITVSRKLTRKKYIKFEQDIYWPPHQIVRSPDTVIIQPVEAVDVLQVTVKFVAFTSFLNPAIINQVIGQFEILADFGRSLLCFM